MITYDQPGTEGVRAAARELDYDRYLAALLAPAHTREGFMALAAFHGEIARIPLTVREPAIGDIRLQWWRDALATPADIATGNPVADAIRHVVRAQALPVDKFVGMIDAYGKLLEAGALTTGAAVDAHAEATEGAMYLLAAKIAGRADPAAQPLLHSAGQADGRVRILRALPALVAKGRNPFGDAEVAALVPPLLRQAEAELARARQLATGAPATILPVILPLALLEPYLAALEDLGSHVADRRADISALTRVWRLLKARALGRV